VVGGIALALIIAGAYISTTQTMLQDLHHRQGVR
jgi:hypothetical protein